MKLKTKAAAALIFTALLMSGCGTAVEENTLPALPSVDKLKGESVSVSAQDAGASPNVNTEPAEAAGAAAVTAEEYESVLTAYGNDEEQTDPAGETAAADAAGDAGENGISDESAEAEEEEKEAFDFKPEYDEEFFADDLFIGDSITTGFSGYGILSGENVFAKIGLNPFTALNTEISVGEENLLLEDELARKSPKRAYIMLGSNGIEWIKCSNMIDSIGTVIDAAQAASPETEIIMLSVPPVTKEYDAANAETDVMDKIRTYNSMLAELCAEKEVGFVDITTMLEDDEGYFVYYYAETDGMHFKPTAYKMVLSKIEYTLS